MISRRDFLQVSVASAGGLLVACQSLEPAEPPAAALVPPAAPKPAGPATFGAYVEITPQNRVILTCAQSEMGQGVHDGLPKILAEELDADWSTVDVRMPWADDAFINPITKRHRTANSESTMVYYELLRKAGATAREMLVAAAAAAWAVPAAECSTKGDSRVYHAGSGRSAAYGDLAAAAAGQAPPAAPRLKDPATFRLIGRATPRKDTPAKTDGSLVFGIDVRLPGMQYAALRRSPAIVGAKLAGFDRDAALRLPGVVDAFEVPDGVAVVAGSTWQARKAAEALELRFDESATKGVDSASMRRRMLAALDDDKAALPGRPAFGGAPYDKAATLAAIAAAPAKHEWTYEVPFLAHAALEPLVATVLVTNDRCEAWAPTQQPDRTRDMMAKVTGLPREQCRLNVTFLGGGFGRKWEVDFVRQAVQVANQAKGRPIKLTWTREQDFQHDYYRPAHIVRTRVGLGRDGALLAMHTRTTGISMWKYQGRPAIPGMGDIFALGLLINDKYAIPQKFADHVETPDPIPVGTWRSVSASMNTFFSESAIDDVAAATRRDPLELRLSMLGGDPRAQGVLRLAAEKAGWGSKLPRGRGRGIALGVGFDSYCAQVVEVSVRGGKVKVEKITCAFDCGTVIDPRNVEAQCMGGIVWGLSAARDGRITFKDGITEQSNFHDGPILRANDVPQIEIHLVPSSHKPGGSGEASVPPVAPALASAIQAATGKRPRRLPLVDAGVALA